MPRCTDTEVLVSGPVAYPETGLKASGWEQRPPRKSTNMCFFLVRVFSFGANFGGGHQHRSPQVEMQARQMHAASLGDPGHKGEVLRKTGIRSCVTNRSDSPFGA